MLKLVKKIFTRTPQTVDVAIPTINVIDKSTIVNEKDFQLMVEACKIQLEQHVAPMWMRAPWKIVANQPEDVGYPIIIVDDSDQAGALGYHTVTPGGKVWGRVFVKSILKAKGKLLEGGPLTVSAVLSHEIIEAFLDPHVNLWADNGKGMNIAYEACDPVEMDSYEITTQSGAKVCVSNFVLPAWFEPNSNPESKFDWLAKVPKPLTTSKGGYMVTVNTKTGAVKNLYGAHNDEALHNSRQEPYMASRSARKLAMKAKEKAETDEVKSS